MNKPDMLSVAEALARLLESARRVEETEIVPTAQAAGRVLAAPQVSAINVPDHDNSSMDGYAVRAADCASGEARLRVSQRIPAGSVPGPLAAGTAARIFTGAPIPPGADAVVMQEVTAADGEYVTIRHRPQAGEWLRYVGEDIRAGSTILPAGWRMRAQDTGLIASVGVPSVSVFRRIKAAVFFTGDELAMPGEPLRKGAIYNSSRFTLPSLLRGFGCEVKDLGNVQDTLAATRAALREAAEGHDLIMTSGGVSVGEEDHVKPAVEAEGRLDMWKIAMKPGKPLAFGHVPRKGGGDAAFIGLPGNPVSSFICTLLFVRPFLLRTQGVADVAPHTYPMRADFDWPQPDARQEFLRARINGQQGLEIFHNQNSSVLTSTVWGDGLIDNPPRHAIKRGDTVKFVPFAELLS
jgi:molybdopterin molybdotransferase